MKNNIRLYTLIFTVILTFLTIIFGVSASAVEQTKNSTSYEINNYYVLKDYHGRPGIFLNDSPTPVYTLDIYTSQLPERDIEKLMSGIRTNSLEEALNMAEDYE